MTKFVSLLLVALALTAGAARAEVWFCEIEQRRANGGWLPPAMALGFEPSAETVLIGLIIGEGLVQTNGQITRRSGANTVISFRIDGAQDRNNRTANLVYTVNFNRSRQSLTISMRPLGYDNFYRANGDCTLEAS